MPVPVGFAQKRGKPTEISLNNSLLGEEYGEAFAHTLQYKYSDYCLKLRNNRLTQKAADTILENISYSLKKLDISYNPQVKDINTDFLFKRLKLDLVELNIEGNSVGDQLIIKLCESDLKIKYLNFSRNLITNKGAMAIAYNLEANSILVGLDISWNNIQAKGAALIFDALSHNSSLQILDMSFNPVGEKHPYKIVDEAVQLKKKKLILNAAQSLSNMFEANKTLIH